MILPILMNFLRQLTNELLKSYQTTLIMIKPIKQVLTENYISKKSKIYFTK